MKPDLWMRAANPWCAWLRLFLLPAMLVPMWFGDMMLAMMVMMAWMMVPMLFRKPTSHGAWITRGALGIRVWRSRPFGSTAVLAAFGATAVTLGLAAAAAVDGRGWLTVWLGGLLILMQLRLHHCAARLVDGPRGAPGALR